jgi:hypothetical protein
VVGLVAMFIDGAAEPCQVMASPRAEQPGPRRDERGAHRYRLNQRETGERQSATRLAAC